MTTHWNGATAERFGDGQFLFCEVGSGGVNMLLKVLLPAGAHKATLTDAPTTLVAFQSAVFTVRSTPITAGQLVRPGE